MPSLRGRFFRLLLKYRHLLKFQKKKVIDWQTSIPELRREVEKTAEMFGKLPAGIEATPITIDGGLPAEWILPAGAAREQVILYFHGGGYVTGSCPGHRAIVAKFVKGSEISALLFGYRLAPEHPFPAALDDAVAAYRWLLEQGVASAKIAFAGDSAGGGLCLAALLALRDQGLPLPAAGVALSPWTDLQCTGASYTTKLKQDPATWPGSWTVFSKYYAGDQDPGNPWISPLYGELKGLPPLLLYVGENEVLLDDSTRFAAKAQDAGVEVTLRVGEGLFHCYPVCAPLFPEAMVAMGEICGFIRTHVDK